MNHIHKIFLTILVVGAIACGVGVWFLRAHPAPLPEVFGVSVTGTTTVGVPASEKVPTSLPPESLPDGMLKYENKYHRFSLQYPKDLQLQEYAEDNGDRTVVFESATHETGFQIYITPYAGTNVTREQFLKDQPSGVYKEPKDILIDGVPAIMFYGAASLMGETREIWFIHDGFLFEVTTYKELDAWLAEIMKTWRFDGVE